MPTAINPGDNIAAIINAGAINQEFDIAAGTYRITTKITPKSGMKLVGASAATVTINASKLLTGWVGAGPYTWGGSALAGPTLVTPAPPSYLYPQSKWAEQLYQDGVPLVCAGAKVAGTVFGSATPAAGEYYVDFDADTLKVASNPSGHTMEFSGNLIAIDSTATGVEVTGLTVCGSNQRGIRANGPSWNIHDNIVRGNLINIGIPGQPSTVVANTIQYGGQYGMNGDGDGQVVTDNEILNNGTLRLYNATGGVYAFGGFKFSSTIGMTFARNLAHHNEGPGCWWDVNCENITISENESHDNSSNGIWYEISYTGTITDNICYANGSAGIYVSTSEGCTVSGNTVYGNGTTAGGEAWQIRLVDANRPQAVSAGHTFPHRGVDNTFTDNTITLTDTSAPNGGQRNAAGSGTWPTDVWTRNTWSSNDYTTPVDTADLWRWNGASLDQAGWILQGQDASPPATYTSGLVALATVGSALGPVQDTTNTTTITYTLGSGETTTTGNLVILYVAAAGSATAVAASATDTRGNVYTVAKSAAPSGSVAASILYSTQSIGLSEVNSDAITVTLSHACTDKQMVIRELTGVDASPLDASCAVSAVLGGAGSTGPAVSTSPASTTVASEYLASMTVWNGSSANTSDTAYTSVYAGHFDNGGAGQTKQMSVKEKITTSVGAQSRTDLLAAAQPWVVLLVPFKANTSAASGSAKAAPRGLSTRSKDTPPSGQDAAYSNRMIDIHWNTLQKTDAGALDATELGRLDGVVAAAVTAGDTATFRFFAGQYSPDWLKAKVGTFKHADTNAGTTPVVKDVAVFWVQAYWDAYDDVMNKLGAHYDADPAVRGIHHGLAQIYYPETMQRHVNAQANRSEMVGGGGGWTGADANGNGGTNIPVPGKGFTFALDVVSQKKAVDIHAARWPTTSMMFAFNPWQVLYSQSEAGITYTGGNQKYWGGDQSGIPNTKMIIDYAVSVLAESNRLVIENNSVRDSYFHQTTLGTNQSVAGSTINAVSTTGFPPSGSAWVVQKATYGVFTSFTYTGKTASSFTGCSGGTGSWAAADDIVALLGDGQGLMYQYFNTKTQCAKYYQHATTQRVGSANNTMRWMIPAMIANACEPTNYSGTLAPYDTTNLAAQDTGLKVNSLPAGGSTAHTPLNTAVPTIDTPSVGYTPTTVLTARLGGWAAGTNALTSLHIQWYKKNPSTNVSSSVRGPTAKATVNLTDTYTLQAGDVGSVIYVSVTATNSDGTSAATLSAETPVVITPANPAPVNTVLPTATPLAPIVGDVITWTTGSWDYAPTSFRWDITRSNDSFATSSLIQSGTSPLWTTSDADIDYAFKASVTANNGQNSTPATSQPTGLVTAAPIITLTVSADTVSSDTSTYTFTGSVFARGVGLTITSFQVNGVDVTLAADGTFSATVSVVAGLNTYTFTAIDSAANTTTASATILSSPSTTASQDILDIEVRIKQRGLG